MLRVRVKLETSDDATMVSVDIRLELWPIALVALIALTFTILLVARAEDLAAIGYYLFRFGLGIALMVASALAAVRMGLSDVRMPLVEVFRGGNVQHAPERIDPHEDMPPLFENDEPLADRLDAWLRERTK